VLLLTSVVLAPARAQQPPERIKREIEHKTAWHVFISCSFFITALDPALGILAIRSSAVHLWAAQNVNGAALDLDGFTRCEELPIVGVRFFAFLHRLCTPAAGLTSRSVL
jgi:hypothetical protein